MQPVKFARRDVLKLGAAAAATALLPAHVARAQAPIALGDITINTFSDGHLTLPSTMLAAGADAGERAAALKAAGQDGDTYKSPLNVTLIRTPSDVILVDVGSGPNFMPTAGKLVEALGDAGVDAEAVTKVVFTHAHPDHIWGTINDFDELNFPNAAYYLNEAEHAFWTADDVLSKVPEDRHSFVAGAQRNLEALADKLVMVKPGQDIVTGVRVIETYGHTPGHVSIEVGTGNDVAMIVGDALTHPVLSFRHPDWSGASDQDPALAVATRKKLLDRLATDKMRIVGYHLPDGGEGRVEKTADGYTFVAI